MHTDDEYIPPGDSAGRDARPDAGRLAEHDDAAHARCTEGREELTPHETGDCAGEGLRERYEKEEDGGS